MGAIFKRRLHKAVGRESSRHREPGLQGRAEFGNPKEKSYPDKGECLLKLLLISHVPCVKNKVIILRVNMPFSGHLIPSCFNREGS